MRRAGVHTKIVTRTKREPPISGKECRRHDIVVMGPMLKRENMAFWRRTDRRWGGFEMMNEAENQHGEPAGGGGGAKA